MQWCPKRHGSTLAAARASIHALLSSLRHNALPLQHTRARLRPAGSLTTSTAWCLSARLIHHICGHMIWRRAWAKHMPQRCRSGKKAPGQADSVVHVKLGNRMKCLDERLSRPLWGRLRHSRRLRLHTVGDAVDVGVDVQLAVIALGRIHGCHLRGPDRKQSTHTTRTPHAFRNRSPQIC